MCQAVCALVVISADFKEKNIKQKMSAITSAPLLLLAPAIWRYSSGVKQLHNFLLKLWISAGATRQRGADLVMCGSADDAALNCISHRGADKRHCVGWITPIKSNVDTKNIPSESSYQGASVGTFRLSTFDFIVEQ